VSEQLSIAARRVRKQVMLEEARKAPRLDTMCWAPPFMAAKPDPDPGYLDWRAQNRPYRSAFRGIVRGERERKILLAVAAARQP
jgi:hypothetical protein